MRVVVLCKRQYTNKDAIDDRYGRLWEIPAALARQGHYQAFVNCGADIGDVKLAVAGHRGKDTQIPATANIIDLGKLQPTDVPVFLNCLDLAVVYNRSSTFGDFCFPQKFYEAVACDLPVVVARVGELSHLLRDQPQLFYEDGDAADLTAAINRQLQDIQRADIKVPGWDDQALRLQELMQAVTAAS